MKFKTLLLGTSLVVLSACNGDASEEEVGTQASDTEETSQENEANTESSKGEESAEVEDGGLIDKESTEQRWINFAGEHGGNAEYLTTDTIEYDPSKQYELSQGAYVAYYSGEEFIETSQMEHGGEIQTVENADNIRISYHKSFNNNINLSEQ